MLIKILIVFVEEHNLNITKLCYSIQFLISNVHHYVYVYHSCVFMLFVICYVMVNFPTRCAILSTTVGGKGPHFRRSADLQLRKTWEVLSLESNSFCTTVDLQLSFYRPLCYNSRAHYPLLQCLRTASAILAGAHSYFLILSFKCEGKCS